VFSDLLRQVFRSNCVHIVTSLAACISDTMLLYCRVLLFKIRLITIIAIIMCHLFVLYSLQVYHDKSTLL